MIERERVRARARVRNHHVGIPGKEKDKLGSVRAVCCFSYSFQVNKSIICSNTYIHKGRSLIE